MHILGFYRRMADKGEFSVLDRAAHKERMIRKTILWDLLLFLVLSAGGVLLHMYAPWLCRIPLLTVFVPVNESIWEHLKLLYFPSVLVISLRYIFTGNLQKGIFTTYAAGLAESMLLMVCGYYTMTGILGNMWLPGDIALYYLCVIFLTGYLHRNASRQKHGNAIGIVFLLLLTGSFFWFTSHPPALGIFAC